MQRHWSLQPIFEAIRCIQQHSGLQIHIKAVPKLIIAESISLASQASQHFVNVLHISTLFRLLVFCFFFFFFLRALWVPCL